MRTSNKIWNIHQACMEVNSGEKIHTYIPYAKGMNEYIIYTTAGFTIAPNENVEVENCQLLGVAYGNNPDEAKDNLLKANPWITEAGFDKSEFVVRQLLTNEQRTAIKEVLNYLWEDEERHYKESGEPDNHIFPILKQLNYLISEDDEVQRRNT